MRIHTNYAALFLAFALGSQTALAQSATHENLDVLTDWSDNRSDQEKLERCAGFTLAVTVYRTIVASNPVYGQNEEEAEKFNWPSELALPATRSKVNWTQAYLDEFGAVVVPSLLPNRAFYQRDKAICQSLAAKY